MSIHLAWTAAAAVTPANLRCEYLNNPLGIDVKQPRLSWVLESSQRGASQSAYQVLVASSLDALKANQADLWDSGKVQSDQTIHIVYAGKPLRSGQRACWKVRIWDRQGQVTDSEPAWWEMGLLASEDWKGQWIWAPPAQVEVKGPGVQNAKWIWFAEGVAPAQTPQGRRYFRRTFELPADRKVKRAMIEFTVDDRYELLVNGEKFRDGGTWQSLKVVDIASRLRPGKNAIAFIGTNESSYAGAVAQLLVEFDSGDPLSIATDKQWKAAKEGPNGWAKPDYDDSQWSAAVELAQYGAQPWNTVRAASTAGEPAPLFRKAFNVSKQVKSARAYVCGLGFFELSLNGKKVGDHVLDPAYTQYNKRVLYVTHDLTDQLRSGRNALGVVLGNGFYNQWVPDVWHFERAPWRSRPKLIVQVQIDYTDGSREIIASDTSWKTATGPILSETARTGEVYDARLEKTGWDTPGYDDSAWAQALAAEMPKNTIRAQMIEPMRVTKTLKPVSVKEAKPGVWVYDMGQNMTGWAKLIISGPAGTQVKMRFGERLHPDGTLDQSNIDPYVEKGSFQTDIYTLKGQGTETWEPRFTYHGFQYVEVTGYPQKMTLDNIQGQVVHTAFPQTGSFECSNEVINKLQHATIWSYIGNFQSFPTDCPHREKNGWTGDAHLAAVLAMYNFDNAAGYTKWINDCKDAQHSNGFIPDVVPDPIWTLNGGPSWESVYILIPWYMYQYNGDQRILEEHYAGMVRLMDRLNGQAKDHILYNGLGDWCFIQPTPTEITVTSYYYQDALIMAQIATMLGKTEDAAKYTRLAQDIRSAYNTKLFDKSTGLYKGGTQSAQCTALYQGIANEEDRPRIFQNLLAALAKKNNHPDTGVFGAHFMPQVLTDNGQVDLAFKMMVQPTGPGWGEWIARGYTTLQENWGRGDSQNHIFFGNISTWFYQSLAGIRIDPEKPAFKHIIIRPYPAGDLTWVKAQTRTIRGLVASSWKKTDRTFTLTITIPPNCTATVYLPGSDKSRLTEGGKACQFQTADPGRIKVEIESGTYEFVVQND